MLISINWLKEFIIGFETISLEEIKSKLIFNGIEIKNIYQLCNATNLIVGKIIKCVSVPGTHLNVCQINLGDEIGVKQIICGAANVRDNLKVIVALPGAKIINKTIQSSVIRNLESYGMCCGLSEICSVKIDDEDKIYELDDKYQIGEKNIIKLLGFDDTILDVKLLANRADLLSVYNLAIEFSSLFNRQLKPLVINEYQGDKNVDFKILNKSTKCSFFCVRVFKKIIVNESPDNLKKYLISMGVKPINNVVDICNYVMLLTGQPLHVYDYDKLPKKELIVEENYETDFVALNQKKYQIKKEDLVVTSGDNIMCLAGIIGGLNSACDQKTTNIVIEAGIFDNTKIRHSTIRLNLNNESSNRFIHGVGKQQKKAIELATFLIKKYCNFDFVSKIITTNEEKQVVKKIILNVNEINNILGTKFELKTIISILEKNFTISNIDDFNINVLVPEHRADIDNINDLAEEIIRFSDFSQINDEFPLIKLKPGFLNIKQQKELEIKKYLRNYLYEISTYVLVDKKNVNYFNYLNSDEPYKLVNPMSDDHLYVRKNLSSSLLNVVSYNIARQNKNFGVFEISNINSKNYAKKNFLAIALTGDQRIQGDLIKYPYSFFSLKGFFNGIIDILNIDINKFTFKEVDINNIELHPNKSAFIYFDDKIIGYLGELHPNIYHCFNIKNSNVLIMEIDLSFLFEIKNNEFKFLPFSNFPSVKRDLSLIVDNNLKIEKIINLVKNSGGFLVKDVSVFDLYKNENFSDKKSIAISIILLKNNATLKDEEIKSVMEKIKSALTKENIIIRD